MSPATLYLFPTEAEAAPFRRLCPEARVVVVGVGMAEAAARSAHAVVQHSPRRVVLCGIAGACDESIGVGDLVEVVSDRVVGLPAAFSCEYATRPITSLRSVRAFTVSRTGQSLGCEEWVTAQNAARENPSLSVQEPSLPAIETSLSAIESALPAIEQMEGAGVAAVAQAFGVEYAHLRAISNGVGDDRSQWRVKEAVDALAHGVAQLFTE